MQKKIIALAVAGLASGAVFAQASNVTIYGNVDVGYRHTSSNSTKTTQIDGNNWSTSRIGFKGEEALGDGMKAMFALEYALYPDSNSGISGDATQSSTIARQQYVGVAGGFGSVVAGRLQPMAKSLSDKYNVLDAANISPMSSLLSAAGSTISSSTRLNNAVAYTTPNISGFTGQIAYSFAGLTTTAANVDTAAYTTDQERILGLAGDYTAGPLSVSLVYHQVKDGNGSSTFAADAKARDTFGGASYDFGILKAKAYVERNKTTTAAGVVQTDKVWGVGADVPVTANDTLTLNYAKLKRPDTAAEDNQSSWMIGAKHTMSKRTYLYAGYIKMNNDSGVTSGGIRSWSTVAGNGANVNGKDTTGYTFGINHVF